MKYSDRLEALQRRVTEAAQALAERGIHPTVTRLRAALGGGSPNDLAPALKAWRASVAPAAGHDVPVPIPPPIADLAHELWRRATAAALLELKIGGATTQASVRTEEAQQLRLEIASLRDQLQQESLTCGEMEVRVARHEAVVREAQSRLDASATRERHLLRELGAARERIVELAATIEQWGSDRPHPARPMRGLSRRHRNPAPRHRSKTRSAPSERKPVANKKRKATSQTAPPRPRRKPARSRRTRG